MRWRQRSLITQILSFVTNRNHGLYSQADAKNYFEMRLIPRGQSGGGVGHDTDVGTGTFGPLQDSEISSAPLYCVRM